VAISKHGVFAALWSIVPDLSDFNPGFSNNDFARSETTIGSYVDGTVEIIKLLPHNAPIPLYEKICATQNPRSSVYGQPTKCAWAIFGQLGSPNVVSNGNKRSVSNLCTDIMKIHEAITT